jgi:hypothetical protein
MRNTKTKVMSNEEFLASLATSNLVGPLALMVVVTAIDKYTAQVARLTPAELNKEFPPNSAFHGASWKRACEEIQTKLADRMGR